MTTIHLQTIIDAPIERCFDLSLSIDLHQVSMERSAEIAVAGRTSGLIALGESVSWVATHFMIRQKMTVTIESLTRPHVFKDVMVDGPFISIEHTHEFKLLGKQTIMSDCFQYDVPFYWAGQFFNWLILKSYMTSLLKNRNKVIKRVAESDEWKDFL